MTRTVGFILRITVLLFSVSPVTAAEMSLGMRPSGIKGEDDRVRVDINRHPWKTIGRLNKDGNFCTGVLVGDDKVLTAAHCFWNKRTGRWSDARFFHFVIGYEKGQYKAVAKGVSFRTAYKTLPDLKRVQLMRDKDWALLTLDKPLGKTFGYVNVSAKGGAAFIKNVNKNGKVEQAGYSRDYAHVLTVHKACRIDGYTLLPGSQKPVYLHQCDATQGDSGSPIFYRKGNRYSLIGIHSATGKLSNGKVIGIAVPSSRFYSAVK